MKAIQLQQDFNNFFDKTRGLVSISRLRTLRRKYNAMNKARIEEGMEEIILSNLEARFERFL